MEATFARIRQATGVNTLEAMVLKLANQSTNHTTLEEEKREAESKLARAKAARQSEDTRFSCMKASGVGNTELNRDISDKLNAEIQEYRVEVLRPCRVMILVLRTCTSTSFCEKNLMWENLKIGRRANYASIPIFAKT